MIIKTVMCVGTWPEDNYEDFEVFDVLDGETDADAIERAESAYSPDDNFYIVETTVVSEDELRISHDHMLKELKSFSTFVEKQQNLGYLTHPEWTARVNKAKDAIEIAEEL